MMIDLGHRGIGMGINCIAFERDFCFCIAFRFSGLHSYFIELAFVPIGIIGLNFHYGSFETCQMSHRMQVMFVIQPATECLSVPCPPPDNIDCRSISSITHPN